MRKVCVLVVAALMLGGCASVGTSFEWANVRAVRVGMTEAELLSTMGGRPNSVTTAGGNQRWTWIHVSSSPFQSGSKHVSFALNNGVVSAVPDVSALQ